MWSWAKTNEDLPTGSSPHKRSAVAPADSTTPSKPLGPPPTQGPPPTGGSTRSHRLPANSPLHPSHHRPGMPPRSPPPTAAAGSSTPLSPQYTVFAPPPTTATTAKPMEESNEATPSPATTHEITSTGNNESAPPQEGRVISNNLHQQQYSEQSPQPNHDDDDDDDDYLSNQEQQQEIAVVAHQEEIPLRETPQSSSAIQNDGVTDESLSNGDNMEHQLVDSDDYELPIDTPPEQATSQLQNDPSTTTTMVVSSPTTKADMRHHHHTTTSPRHETRLVKHSHFHFVGDESRVVSEWNAWEEHSLRQRQEFNSRVHELTCHTARLTAAVARENTQRHQQLDESFLKDHVRGPLNLLVDRWALLQDGYRYDNGSTTQENDDSMQQTTPSGSVPPPPASGNSTNTNNGNGGNYYRFKALSSRISALDSHMGKSIFEIIPQVRREKLSCLLYELQELVKTTRRHRLEAAKAEGVLATKLENVAGRVAAMYQQEHTTRCTIVAVANSRAFGDDGNIYGDFLGSEHSKVQHLLKEIKGLRQQLAQQRQERKEQDAYLQELIASKSAAMRSALLEAVGDPDD